jgi:hypothetical protein
MKTFSIKIKFITDYLQARFTENAKSELENYVSNGIVKSDDDSWITLLHIDEEGIYIPSIQIRNCLVNAGRDFKMKKSRKSLQQWVISNVMILPEKIYLGTNKPDEVLVSYPARKDGNRVTIKHPVFKSGRIIDFSLNILDEDMENKAIKSLLEQAGKMYGIGARRRDMFGRFELLSM